MIRYSRKGWRRGAQNADTITHTAGVRGNNDRVGKPTLLGKVLDSNWTTVKIIYGHARSEKPLDLPAVKVDRNNAVNSHRLKKACNIGS